MALDTTRPLFHRHRYVYPCGAKQTKGMQRYGTPSALAMVRRV